MRDKDRIKPIIEKLEELWTSAPDIRFGQLMHIVSTNLHEDLFNAEDEIWLKAIQDTIDNLEYTEG